MACNITVFTKWFLTPLKVLENILKVLEIISFFFLQFTKYTGWPRNSEHIDADIMVLLFFESEAHFEARKKGEIFLNFSKYILKNFNAGF